MPSASQTTLARTAKCKNDVCDTSGRTFREYCQETSIHGLKYIVQDDSHWLERVGWVLMFAAGVCFSGYFCFQMWQKWDQEPVLLSLDSNRYPLDSSLSNIKFPAVTICNVNKVSKRKLLQVLQDDSRFNNISYDVMQKTLRYMTKLDRAINSGDDLRSLDRLYNSSNIKPTDLFDILKKTTPTCRDLMMDCIWQGLPEPCVEYFSFLPSDDGICCTFNGASYNDPELGIHSSPHELLNVSGNGYRMGLAVVMNAAVDDYSVTNGKFDGFKILVHQNHEFPDVADRGFVIGPGSEAFVGLKGITSYNTEEVAIKVAKDKRKCQVKEEEGTQKLDFFDRYSQTACVVECATKLMREKCRCRPYFLKADNSTQLCYMESYTCISDVYEDVRQHGEQICSQCVPTCSDIWFEPEISYAPFPGHGFVLSRTYKRLVAGINISSETDGEQFLKSNVAVLHVYFKDKTGVRYKTDIRFGIEDFISAMGGLLGLGLGMSFISAIEIFYFFCLRWYCHSRSVRDEFQGNGRSDLHPDNKTWPSTSTVATSDSNLELGEPVPTKRNINQYPR